MTDILFAFPARKTGWRVAPPIAKRRAGIKMAAPSEIRPEALGCVSENVQQRAGGATGNPERSRESRVPKSAKRGGAPGEASE